MFFNNKKLDEFTINQILWISLALYLLIVSIFPVYVFASPPKYLSILDYSFISSGVAGGDIRLLVFNTFESPFTPFLKFFINYIKLLFDNDEVASLWIFRSVSLLNTCLMALLLIIYMRSRLLSFILFVSVISYPFIHEIERGQWNFICMGLVALAFKYFEMKPLRSLFLFSLAIQLKVFPVFFLPIFLYKKGGLNFICWLLAITTLLFLIFGYNEFNYFLNNQIINSSKLSDGWELNPSLISFILLFGKLFNIKISGALISIILFLIYVILMYKREDFDDYSLFFLISVWVILWIPKSYDYRISIILIPTLMFLDYFIRNNFSNSKLSKWKFFIGFNLLISLIYIKVNFIAHGIAKFLPFLFTLNSEQVQVAGQLLGSRVIFLVTVFILIFSSICLKKND